MTAQMARDHWHPPEMTGRQVVLRRHVPANLEAVARWYRDPELARLSRYQTQPMDHDEVEHGGQLAGPMPTSSRPRSIDTAW